MENWKLFVERQINELIVHGEAEEELYELNRRDQIPGGIGDKYEVWDVNPEELELGIRVEMEHTNDREIAKEIALDHLAEDPKYYSKLGEFH